MGASPNSEHLGLFWPYLPHLTLQLCIVLFMDSLFFRENSVKISYFFSTGPQSFSLGRMHGSKSEFGALRLVLAISPSSDLGILYCFFSWTPYSSGKILSNFHNFSQPVRPIGVQFSRFIKLACMEHWFWWFWSSIPTWLGPISFRSVLGYIVGPF